MTTARSRREVSFRDYLDEKEKAALFELTALCNAADGTQYSPPEDADCFFLLWEIQKPDTGADEKGRAGEFAADCTADGRNKQEGSGCHADKKVYSGKNAEEGSVNQETAVRAEKEIRCLSAALCVFHMGDTREGKEIDELSAFTRPEARRTGCFQKLIEMAAPLLRPVQRFAVYRTGTADAVLAAIGAVHGGDEHMMELCLTERGAGAACCESAGGGSRQCGNTVEALSARPRAAAVGKSEKMQLQYLQNADGMDVQARQGMCACRFYGDQVYLYGMLIYARYRRKGFGRRFLTALFAKLRADGYRSVLLEVSSENVPAMHLYTSLGFEIKETVSYFYREH